MQIKTWMNDPFHWYMDLQLSVNQLWLHAFIELFYKMFHFQYMRETDRKRRHQV